MLGVVGNILGLYRDKGMETTYYIPIGCIYIYIVLSLSLSFSSFGGGRVVIVGKKEYAI